jgi:hypothetical protein
MTSLHEFAAQFVQVAIAADHSFIRTGDVGEVRKGVAFWEQVEASGAFANEPPEALVDLHISVSMLYARRFQVDARREDLERALSYLRRAQPHAIPGSPADFQARTASAAWLMMRFDADGEREDIDQAIAGWDELWQMHGEASPDRGLAAINLGRSLLRRYDLTSDLDDLARGCGFLELASIELEQDHPALPDVRTELRAIAAARSALET